MTLTSNPLRAMTMTYSRAKFKVNGQLVPKIEWKQTDGRTDGRTDGGDRITSLANAVGKYSFFGFRCTKEVTLVYECTLRCDVILAVELFLC